MIGQIDTIEIGSYINKKGSKKKRRVVNFALIKFIDEDSLDRLMNRNQAQLMVNDYIENKKNRSVSLNYDTMKDDDEEAEVDEDGFVIAKWQPNKKRFNGGGASFKVSKNREEDEEEIVKKRNKKNEKGDFYWNYQLMDKKRQSTFL